MANDIYSNKKVVQVCNLERVKFLFFLQILMSVQKTMVDALSCVIILSAVTRVVVTMDMSWMWMDTHAEVHL